MIAKIPINNPLLRAYLPALFNVNKSGQFILDKRSLTGTVILAFLQVAQKRDVESVSKYVDPDNLVSFDVSKYAVRRGTPKYLLTYSEIVTINQTLRREFNLRFTEHWMAFISAGFSVTDAVDAFICENRLDEYYLGDLSTLQRRIMRYRLDSLRQVRRKMKRKVEYKKSLHRKKTLL